MCEFSCFAHVQAGFIKRPWYRRSRHCDSSCQESVQQLSICVRSKRRHAKFERISRPVGLSDSLDTRFFVIAMAPPVVTRKLHNPEAKEICQVLQNALKSNFADVEVEEVDCPDLSKKPWSLAAEGICGAPHIVDVGGPAYLEPLPQLNKLYSFKEIGRLINRDGCFCLGAGAGSPRVMGVNSELMPNLRVDGSSNNTRVATVDQTDPSKYILEEYRSDEFALLCNLLASDGAKGKVIHVRADNRTGNKNFVTCMREALKERYGNDHPVGMGGVFAIKAGMVRAHVMPDFSKTPLRDSAAVQAWLNFYNMAAPLTCLTVFVSGDMGMKLREEHTHFFSDHGCGGHYHNDLDDHQPVAYEGYFVLAEQLSRVDQP